MAVAAAGVLFAAIPLIVVIMVWVLSLLDVRFANLVYKFHLMRLAILHLLFSTDKKWKRQPDAALLTGSEEYSKTLILIRHGESAWNLVFNKGFNSTFPSRLFGAIWKEFLLLTTLDSVFVDSPLDEEGCEQSKGLQNFIENSEDPGISAVLNGSQGSSVLCCSNLRRALSTMTIGMWGRLRRTQERIHVLSCLQEVTFNVDGVALAKPYTAPMLSDTERKAIDTHGSEFEPDRYYDCTDNKGDKDIQGSGIDRMKEFCEWCFNRDEPTIIAGGHSLYFRFFFQTFLPRNSRHIAKKLKMENCSVVKLILFKGVKNGKVMYAIKEDTVEPLYLGFEEKKSKKKAE